MNNKVLLWFRRDFRLKDNPALRAALSESDEVIPVFIWSPEEESPWAPGGASKWWLHHSLASLSESLASKGSYLIIRQGGCLEELRLLLSEHKAAGVYWNRLYDPIIVERDKEIKEQLVSEGFEVKSFPGNLLKEPWEIQNSSKKPFLVFTPFWRKLKEEYHHEKPLGEPKTISSPSKKPQSLVLDQLELLPKINWDEGFYPIWNPGEKGALQTLRVFLKNPVVDYADHRDRPDLSGTSLLAAHLHFGEISPRQVWDQVVKKEEEKNISSADTEPFLRQLAWREFGHQLLFNFPNTDKHPLREEFKKFPWKKNKRALAKWQKGKTGYPLVDAGMRQLWATGTMHNRVRMVVASFLVKHLLIPWQEGTKWFWDTLVDADLANNTLGWQWTAGCGADAAPYFRVFNPIIQGERFDPEGNYVRKWIPELKEIPTKWIHRPWEAPEEILASANVELGVDYPIPIIEHQEGRERALDAYNDFKR